MPSSHHFGLLKDYFPVLGDLMALTANFQIHQHRDVENKYVHTEPESLQKELILLITFKTMVSQRI